MTKVNPAYIAQVAQQTCTSAPPVPAAKEKLIREKFCSELEDHLKTQYLQVLLKNHEAISLDWFDLGRAKTLLHEITLKTSEPVFVKQFQIPYAHQAEVEK